MLKVPSSAPAELSDDGIAVAVEVDVEVCVRTRLSKRSVLANIWAERCCWVTHVSGDVQLRHVMGQHRYNFGHGRHFE